MTISHFASGPKTGRGSAGFFAGTFEGITAGVAESATTIFTGGGAGGGGCAACSAAGASTTSIVRATGARLVFVATLGLAESRRYDQVTGKRKVAPCSRPGASSSGNDGLDEFSTSLLYHPIYWAIWNWPTGYRSTGESRYAGIITGPWPVKPNPSPNWRKRLTRRLRCCRGCNRA